jgi:hypothetical protein
MRLPGIEKNKDRSFMKITPLGINPETCPMCDEWIGSKSDLVRISRAHVKCHTTLSLIHDEIMKDSPSIAAIRELVSQIISKTA